MKKSILIIPALLFAANGAFAQSVNQGSNNANGSNNAGQAAAQAMSAMLQAMSAMEQSQCGPHNPGACAMAALHAMMAMLAAMQAGEHGNVAGQAATTAFNSDAYSAGGGGTADDTVTRADSGTGVMRPVDDNLKKLINSIDGAKLDPKTGVVSYNGKNLNDVDPTSPTSLSSAGFSDAQIGQIMALNDKLNAAVAAKVGALTASNGYEEGGGGDSGVGGGSGSGAGGTKIVGAGSSKLDRAPTSVAGMQKNFNGEPIGVSGDNIFTMMTRRYQTKERQSAFYDELDLALKQK